MLTKRLLMRIKAGFLLFGLASMIRVQANGQAPKPSFEVATIKPAADDSFPTQAMDAWADDIRFGGGPGSDTPSVWRARGVTLKMLLGRAFQILPAQIVGPPWMETDRYDVVATLDPRAGIEALGPMLQQLIEDRFAAKFHRESRTLPVYRLLVAKGGHRLANPRPDATAEEISAAMVKSIGAVGTGRLQGNRSLSQRDATTARLAQGLSAHLDRPVKDMTQLNGRYSFSLKWYSKDAAPSIFDAVEDQLGLRLERATEAMDVLVIDQVRRAPTEN